MKCPQCQDEFALTWTIYFKAPFGRFACPLCGTRLIGRHRWFYWPLVVAGACAGAIPLGYLGYCVAGGAAIAGIGAGIGGYLTGVPFDKWLESKFCILTIAPRGTKR